MEEQNEKKTVIQQQKTVREVRPLTDREMLKIIKEEKHLPIILRKPIKLERLISLYNKYWNNEFTDESDDYFSDDF